MTELAAQDRFTPAIEPAAVQPLDDYEALLATIRATINRLDTTNEAIETLAGLPSGFLSKVVAKRHVRFFGPSVFFVLETLGLKLAVVQDRELAERYRDRLPARRQARAGQARQHNGHRPAAV